LLSKVPPNQTDFNVTGLTPKKKYKIRVKAVNKEGESEPLETDDFITAKNPYGKTVSIQQIMYSIFFVINDGTPAFHFLSLTFLDTVS
jgi:hypothetical protein